MAGGNLHRFADALSIQLQLLGVTEQEIIEAQMAVESTAAHLAAERASIADLKRLRQLIDESVIVRDTPEKFTDSAMSFHLAIAEASHNRVLIAQLSALHHVLRPVYSHRTSRTIADRVVEAHRGLLATIESRDAAQSKLAMCFHLEGVYRRSRSAGKTAPARSQQKGKRS